MKTQYTKTYEKPVLRRNFIAINTYLKQKEDLKRKKKSQINSLVVYLTELAKQEQDDPKLAEGRE